MSEAYAKPVFNDEVHQRGEPACGECHSGYPHECECGGLIHIEFPLEDEGARCDRCDSPRYVTPLEARRPIELRRFDWNKMEFEA